MMYFTATSVIKLVYKYFCAVSNLDSAIINAVTIEIGSLKRQQKVFFESLPNCM